MAKIRHRGEIGHLVDDDFRFCGDHGGANGRSIETVDGHGLRTHSLDGFGLRRRARHSSDEMTGGNQCRNQFAADGAGRASNKNSHDLILATVATAGS